MDTASDARRYNFFILDNEAIDNYDLNPYEGWLYVIIVRHVNQKTGVAFPSLATLSEKTHMSEPTVIKYMKSLVEKKLITITQQCDPDTQEHKVNHYTVRGVVKEVNQGGKADLPGVVKEVKSNNTKINKTNQKDEKTIASDDATREPKPKRKRSEKQLALDAMKNALADAFGLPHETVTRTKWNEFGRAGKELLEVGATPDDMKPLYAWCKRKGWPSFTSMGMVKEYASFNATRRKLTRPLPTTTTSYATRQALLGEDAS